MCVFLGMEIKVIVYEVSEIYGFINGHLYGCPFDSYL